MFLKRDIKNINKQLELIKSSDTNARLTTESFDKDITELCVNVNAVLDERREAVIKAERSNAEFKRAITNISHDLRTPLTGAIGYAQMLRDDELPAEKRREYSNIIEQRLASLSKLMNSLFEYTQIMEGRTVFNITKINICNIARDVVSQFYDDFTSKGFEISVVLPDSPVFAECDEAALTRVLRNLVRNACEHGCERCEISAESGVITVKNRVRGIDSLDVERIFERFYTSDLSRTGGNAGLGLAISKELIRSMGGDIAAEKDGDMLLVKIFTFKE